jgi:hypothetical protein
MAGRAPSATLARDADEMTAQNVSRTCPHFHPSRYPLCGAVGGLLSPTLFQIERHCTSGEFDCCPIYRQRAQTGCDVPVDDSEALLSGQAAPAR